MLHEWRIKATVVSAILAASIGAAAAEPSSISTAFDQQAAFQGTTNGGRDMAALSMLSVPIPTSIVLLGSALVGVMALGRRTTAGRLTDTENLSGSADS